MSSTQPVVFSRPYRSANELENLAAVLESGHIHGDGVFTARASEQLRAITRADDLLLTTSGSHALEMTSILLDLTVGDEVILPSFTFPSAANAIALTGATIVFVDIDPSTGNIDPQKIERHITPRTKAISVMHYGGVGVDMDAVLEIAGAQAIPVIEDNAHGLGARRNGNSLGTLGVMGIQSFHDTKNIQCGEGGAILINDERYLSRAEMIREKGTDRSRFLRGQVDKYTWTEIGSSYLPSELNAAVLESQLAEFDTIQASRHAVWDAYDRELRGWAHEQGVTPMFVPEGSEHPAHLYYLLMPTHDEQTRFISHMREHGIVAVFHYVPLDSSPAGLAFGFAPEPCVATLNFSTRLVRLPLWGGMTEADTARVIDAALAYRVGR